MAEEINNSPNGDEDLKVRGTHKSYKKRKSGKIYTVIIVVLLCVMGFSGYQIVSTLLRNKQAKDTYDDIINNFVVFVPETETEAVLQPETEANAETAATEAPTAATAEPSSQADAAESMESSEESMTAEESTEAPTDPPETQAAPAPTQTPQKNPVYTLSVDFARLKSINSDVCAWLQGQGNIVNYPVVQGRDNDYYLKHLINGSYNTNGTLFVHAQNHFLQDDVTYIFGHHMQSGAMFGSLKKYDSSAYYRSNPEFKLYTPGKTYTLRIYAVFYGTGSDRITFNYSNASSFNTAMAAYASRSIHKPQISVSYGDKFVCLSTCAYHVNDGRYFVLCKIMN